MTPIAVLMELATVLIAMGLVLALAFFSIRFLKKVQSGAPTADEIRFVRALPLGARERAAVVIWRDEVLLLGVTAGGVTVLDRRKRSPEEIAEDEVRTEVSTSPRSAGWRGAVARLARRDTLRPPRP